MGPSSRKMQKIVPVFNTYLYHFTQNATYSTRRPLIKACQANQLPNGPKQDLRARSLPPRVREQTQRQSDDSRHSPLHIPQILPGRKHKYHRIWPIRKTK